MGGLKRIALDDLIAQLQSRSDLAPDQAGAAVTCLISEDVPAETKAQFLSALAQKGETHDEIAAFAAQFRDRAVRPPIDAETRRRGIIDVCGTGGDKLNTFNISTTVAILVAAAGVPVAKHGNRAITSQSGSADVLEALGIPIDLTPDQAAVSLRELNFAFFFAQKYHPAYKQILPARKLCAERGQRTIFNFIGPLLNPAQPCFQLLGVPHGDLCEPLARVLQQLGLHRAMVVSGRVGDAWLDELSILGDNTIAEFYQERGFSTSVTQPDPEQISPATLDDLKGGDRQTNALIIQSILTGQERGPKRSATLLNAGAALFVANKCKSLTAGFDLAASLIDRGAAAAKLNDLIRWKPQPPPGS